MKIYLPLYKKPATPHCGLASVGDGQSWEEMPCKCCGGVGCQTTVPCLPRGKKPTVYILYFGGFVLSSSFPESILAMCLQFHWLRVGAAAP